MHGQEILRKRLNAGEQRFVIALTQASTIPAWLVDLGGKPMSLGLDLSGGVHFLLEVDMEKFLGDRMLSSQEAIRDLLVEARLRYANRDWVDGAQLRIAFQAEDARNEAAVLIGDQFDEFLIQERDVEDKPGLILTVTEEKVRELEDLAITQNLQSLRNRVNELGVSEPLVQRLGRSRIVLDLPGVQDSARAKEIINKFANLEFRLVARPNTRSSQTERFEYEGAPVLLETVNIVTGDQVTNAIQEFDPETAQPQVSITLDNDGGRAMNEVTKDNVGNSMAILFKELQVRTRTEERDGETVTVPYTVEHKRVINVATIQSALGFRFPDHGSVAERGARSVAAAACRRPGGTHVHRRRTHRGCESRAMKTSLPDSSRCSSASPSSCCSCWSTTACSGLRRTWHLTANVMLLVSVMSVLGATLTLPGIAGIVLTVGMAVDANVLIFSRIREELKERSPQAAIHGRFRSGAPDHPRFEYHYLFRGDYPVLSRQRTGKGLRRHAGHRHRHLSVHGGDGHPGAGESDVWRTQARRV